MAAVAAALVIGLYDRISCRKEHNKNDEHSKRARQYMPCSFAFKNAYCLILRILHKKP